MTDMAIGDWPCCDRCGRELTGFRGDVTQRAPLLCGECYISETWTDPQATLGGVVAAGSRCMCGVNEAVMVLNSPRWGAWDACQPCGNEQLAVLHGADVTKMARPDLIKREALRCIELDRMLSI